MILLDTHALIWWITDPRRIPAKATKVITSALAKKEVLGVSSFSAWEITLLARVGRLKLSMHVDVWLDKVESLPFVAFHPVGNRVARRSFALPFETRDPADRIIVATAVEQGATLVTADRRMQAYQGVKTVWD